MRALLCRRWGGPEALAVETIPSPSPAPGEVVIGVSFAALNFLDTLIIQGRYQVRPPLPFSPAAEVAGRILATGQGTRHFKPGDRVMSYVGYGGAQEEVAVDARRVVAVPEGVSDEAAAGLHIAYGTTLHALKDRAQIQAGESLVVLGAAGGTGQAAVEIGRLLGARVIACASSEEKLAFASALGADKTINTTMGPLKEAIRAAAGDEGADVVYDPVGGEATEAAVRALGWRGRLLVIGFASGDIARLPLNLALLKEASILGVHWGKHVEMEPDLHASHMRQILEWVSRGDIAPHIDATYALEDGGRAIESIAQRRVKGKVLLRI
jgi:NADPH2:quinone reductase